MSPANCRSNPGPAKVLGLVVTIVLVLLLGPQLSAQASLFTPAEKARLIEMTRHDRAAKAEFSAIREQADASLYDSPNPIKVIQTEGKLAGDPVKVATQASLGDMHALFVLGYAYEVTGETKYAAKVRAFVLAWAATNQPTGDPIDETNLEPLLIAYDQTRDTFSLTDRNAADEYLRRLIRAEWDAKQGITNWQSHRLKIIGLAAYVLKDDAQVARALRAFKEQVSANLYPDGSSYDFHERDALHYHVYDLEPLLTLAIAARKNGVDLYDYTSPSTSSLRKSVHFLMPYCAGDEQHREFVNSKVEFDRKRAANGESGYVIGHLFRPEEGLKALTLAAYFDRAVDPVVTSLASHDRSLAEAWTLVLDEAGRPE